jgi:DNA primase
MTLLWRMADEPLLCFDGDSAGQKAAYRAVETVLPLLAPGKSLAFVFLPEGLDPDDLLQRSGPDAVAGALRATKPLVDVLWSKELAAGDWTTPERRAQLETRLAELVGTIANKTVRQYYEQETRRRLREQFNQYRSNWNDQQRGGQQNARGNGRFAANPNRKLAGGFTGPKRGAFYPGPPLAATASLAGSALIQGGQGGGERALHGREVLLVQTLLNHPWLLDDYFEDVATTYFEAELLQRLRDCILSVYSQQNPLDKEALHHQLGKLGYHSLLAQVEHAITHHSDWDTQPHASHDDVLKGWKHRLALHRKSVELKRELESASRAYEIEQSEENYLRLQDLSRQSWSVEGVEAALEGSGSNAQS